MPSTTVTVRVGPHGDFTNLQDALNNVSLGTTILLQPGVRIPRQTTMDLSSQTKQREMGGS